MIDKQKFKVYCSNISKSITDETETDDTPLILEGIASTTGEDLEGDYMTPECIESMKQQALNCNIHGDHLYELSNVIGTVTEVIETDENTLKIRFNVLPSFKNTINEFLENGINLGLSIRGTVTDYVELADGWKINDLKLHEISLTPLPANWDTFGSVTVTNKNLTEANCLNGVCKQILKQIKNENKINKKSK